MATVPPQIVNPAAVEAWASSDPADAPYRIFVPSAIGILSVVVWDILECLPQEFNLLFYQPFTYVKVVYLFARLSPFFFLLFHAVFITQTHNNCQPWMHFLSTMYAFMHISTGFLFLLRLRAVYTDNKICQRIFTAAWGLHAVSSFFQYPSGIGAHIGPTLYCQAIARHTFLGIMLFIQPIYEAMVCLAITYKVCFAGSHNQQPIRFWWSLWWGKNPFTRLRKRLVQDSQLYFIITIILKLAQLTIYLVAHRILLVFSSLIDIAITGILATKIYRNFKIGQPGMMGDALWAVGSLRYQPTDLNSRTPEIPENVELVKPVVPLATLQLT